MGHFTDLYLVVVDRSKWTEASASGIAISSAGLSLYCSDGKR